MSWNGRSTRVVPPQGAFAQPPFSWIDGQLFAWLQGKGTYIKGKLKKYASICLKIRTIINLLYSVYGPKTCICIRFCLPFFVFVWANIIKYNETDVKGYSYIWPQITCVIQQNKNAMKRILQLLTAVMSLSIMGTVQTWAEFSLSSDSATLAAESYPRRMVMEEATATWCG